MKATTKFYGMLTCAFMLATSIVYATCGPAYGVTGGTCTPTNDGLACYMSPYHNGGCKGTGKGNCISSNISEPIVVCDWWNNGTCTPGGVIGSQMVLSGQDTSGMCGG